MTIKPTASADAAHPTTRLSGLLENIVSVSRSTSVKVLDWRVIHASPEMAQALQVSEGAKLRKAVRRRSASAGPVSLITTYVPDELVRGYGRKELADWLTDPGHPLTARVYVNRIWHHLFGRGIVANVIDW